MIRPTYEVAHIIAKHLDRIKKSKLFTHHLRTLEAIRRCRTSALGSHTEGCDHCGKTKISYNSCRNRHCPKCQGLHKEMWIIQQEDMLLPVSYFHVVFTLPHELNLLSIYNQRWMYNLLFKAAWHTINTLANDEKWLGAKSAATMVLHTWSQTLGLHPHLHCIVPNGGLDKDNHWRFPKRGNGNFLFPVLAMNKLFKGFFMEYIKAALLSNELNLPEKSNFNSKEFIDLLYSKSWVVYTKKPFSTVNHVVQYLARYAHRVAITNHRIKSIDNDEVTFEYKDYKDKAAKKSMTFTTQEFIRRFCLHILEPGFRKIRQYGLSSNASKLKSINKARIALGLKMIILLDRKERKELALLRLFKEQSNLCPHCKVGHLHIIYAQEENKGPPFHPNALEQIR